MRPNPLTKIDFYKADHRRQYPEGTSLVYSNFTPRKSRIPGIKSVLCAGMQAMIVSFLVHEWNEGFFKLDKRIVVAKYKRIMDNALGKDSVPVDHIEELHDLGYLPLHIKALPEGTLVPIGVPCFTIRNTRPEAFWLVNYLESAISNLIWKPTTSATIAFQYRKVFEKFYRETVDAGGEGIDFVKWQGHDFSYRGMSGEWDANTSAAGHAFSFYGSDTVSVIPFLEEYYHANCEQEMIVGSVPATEHSVMCMGGKGDEIGTFERLLNLYPKDTFSVVSDTWDLWKVLIEYLPALKDKILARNGKLVIRPDSGDPVDIICGKITKDNMVILEDADENTYLGDYSCWKDNVKYFKVGNKTYLYEGWEMSVSDATEIKISDAEGKGVVELLWNIFGGTITKEGYKQLDSHIGVIYGDSITMERQTQILERLKAKGFASTNVVLGIGSFTYEYQTRDTFGFAMKATYGEITSPVTSSQIEAREIFKDPITDDGTKKSAKGLLMVYKDENGEIKLKDQCTWEEESQGLLETVFLDGRLGQQMTLKEIRERINNYLK